MSPFDPTGTGAYVPVSRVKPITADFVGDATKGGSNNVQAFLDARRFIKAPCYARLTDLPAFTHNGNVLTGVANGSLQDPNNPGLSLGRRLLIDFTVTDAPIERLRASGIFVVTHTGTPTTPFTLTRAPDADTSAEVFGPQGALVWVTAGLHRGTVWQVGASAQQSVLNDTPVLIFPFEVAGSGSGGGTPVTAPDVQAFVDSRQAVKAPCDVAATQDIPGTYANNTFTSANSQRVSEADLMRSFDGEIALGVGSRILLHQQSDDTQNGVYEVQDAGAPDRPFVLKRAADAATPELCNGSVTVLKGVQHGGTTWALRSIDGQVFVSKISPRVGAYAHAMAYVATENVTSLGTGDYILAPVPGQLQIGDTTPLDRDRVLVAGQTVAAQNGIYEVLDKGSTTTPYILKRAVAKQDLKNGLLVVGNGQLYGTSVTSAGAVSFTLVSAGGGSVDDGTLLKRPLLVTDSAAQANPAVGEGLFLQLSAGNAQQDIIVLLKRPAEPLTVILPEPGATHYGQRLTIKDTCGDLDARRVRVFCTNGDTGIDGYLREIPLSIPYMSLTFVRERDPAGIGTWYII